MATTAGNLSNLYDHLGQYDEAVEMHERALRIEEGAFGGDDVEVAVTVNNLASVNKAQGRLEKAAAMHERALGIREAGGGVFTPWVMVPGFDGGSNFRAADESTPLSGGFYTSHQRRVEKMVVHFIDHKDAAGWVKTKGAR